VQRLDLEIPIGRQRHFGLGEDGKSLTAARRGEKEEADARRTG
jgi:hypothetical protein